MDLYDDPVVVVTEGTSDLTYGGVDIAQYFRGWTITRSIMPPVSVDDLVIAGRDGAIPNGHRTEPLTLTLTGALNAHDRKTVEAIRQRLGRLLLPQFQKVDGRAQLYIGEHFEGDLGVEHYIYYDAIVKGSTDLDRAYAYPHVSIDFYVQDGYGYDGVLKEATISSSTNLQIGGNIITWPKIQVLTRTSGDFTITRTATVTGEKTRHITTPYQYTCTIDCENESVLTSNNTPIEFDLDSDFFFLAPHRANMLSVSGGTAKITWRERYV